MTIRKPIFIIGAGRSGTTLLYRLLATHPELCWFSRHSNKRPDSRTAPLRHRVLDLPFLGARIKRDIIHSRRPRSSIRPAEADRIYLSYCGFEENRKTTEEDLAPETEKRFKTIVERHLRLTGKKRFLNKQTSNVQRIRIVNKMFPDAYYIHLMRDGRAVANSLYSVDWWPNLPLWWLGRKPSEWKERGKDPIELCARHWMRNVEEIYLNRDLLENRYVEIRYEDLTSDVRGVLDRVTDFCELKRSTGFRNLLPESLPDGNYKWKERLTESQKRILNALVTEFEKDLERGFRSGL